MFAYYFVYIYKFICSDFICLVSYSLSDCFYKVYAFFNLFVYKPYMWIYWVYFYLPIINTMIIFLHSQEASAYH